MACLFQHRHQFAKIVDLAIEHQPDFAILIRHWLMTRGSEILNRQATKAKTNTRSAEISLIVRTTMLLSRCHLTQKRFSSKTFPVQLQETTDTTHDNFTFFPNKCQLLYVLCSTNKQILQLCMY